MGELFSAILELSFKASFLILAVTLLRLVLRRAPRRIICALWLLVGLRLVLPFSLESPLSLIPEAEVPGAREQTSIIEQDQSVNTQASVGLPQINYSPVSPAATLPPVTVTPAESTAPMVVEPEETPLVAEQIAAVVWLCGLTLMLGYLAISYLLLRRRVAEAVPDGVGVWKCAAVRSPFVLGLLRPRVYISYGMSAEQREYVLAHERAHIAHRDHWWKPLGFLILAVHWFNPLVWLAYVLLCRDIELACDERVIKSMEPQERKGYSLALLSCAVKASPLAACPLAFGEVGVKQRIKSVLSYKKPTVWMILAALLCALAAGLFFLTDPKGTDCSEEAEAVIDAFILERRNTEGMSACRLQSIEMLNERLYEFQYKEYLESEPGSLYRQKYGLFHGLLCTGYAACEENGLWNIYSSIHDVPGSALVGRDCADDAGRVIYEYLEAYSRSAMEAREYLYYPEGVLESVVTTEGIGEYKLEEVTKRNELLYAFDFSYTPDLDPLYYYKTGEPRGEVRVTRYAFLIDGEWKIATMFGYIPGHILRGESEDNIPESPASGEAAPSYDCPDEVLDTYYRWIASRSVETGDRDTWYELSYRGEDAPELNDPLMFSADLLTDKIESVARVNDSLYEFIHIYTSKYLDYEMGAQHFVGLIDGAWRVMLYDAVPGAIREGIENCDRWTWDDEGNQVIIPAHSYTDPELPVEAHLMDKLKFYLPTMHSAGVYDLYLGVSGGVPIYYADGTFCGAMELNCAMAARIENGEIVVVDDGANHASFVSEFESIDHSVPCAVAEFSDDSGGNFWYVIFAEEGCDFCYALKLDTGYFSREEAIRMARAVRFTADAFTSFADDERMYWPIIDSYASALSRGLLPTDLRALGLNEAMSGSDDPLTYFGWAIKDLDGRAFPELLIGAQSFEAGRGTPVYALYTLNLEHKVMEVFSSTDRSMHYYISDYYFLHHSSAGVGNSSDLYYRFYGDHLAELESAPDTKVYGLTLTPFSSVTGYSSDYGVQLTGASPYVDYWGYEEAAYYIRSGGETTAIHVPRPADIARRAAEIVNSGGLELLSEAAFEARTESLRYGSEELYLASDNGKSSIRFVKDELGFYIELANTAGLSRYRITDAEQLEKTRLLMYNSPQNVYLDWDEPAEYALSNGLSLGMSYAEIVSIMGQPKSIEPVHEENVDSSMYYLKYPGEAALCLMADLNAPVEEATLWFAQIYSDSISFGRIASTDRSLKYIASLYGINPVAIEPDSEHLPVLQNLSIPHEGYYDSAFALVPRDESLWENDPPSCAVLLFKDGKLECVYLRYAVALDLQPSLTAPR